MSGPQFGLVVDFARSGWSDGVFQEFVDSWKSVYGSPTCKAVAAYAFDRSIVEVRTVPIPHSGVKANIYDKVKRRLLFQGLQVADVRYEVTLYKDIVCLSACLRPKKRIFPGVFVPLPQPHRGAERARERNPPRAGDRAAAPPQRLFAANRGGRLRARPGTRTLAPGQRKNDLRGAPDRRRRAGVK